MIQNIFDIFIILSYYLRRVNQSDVKHFLCALFVVFISANSLPQSLKESDVMAAPSEGGFGEIEHVLDPNYVLNLETMKPRGTWYEASVPDTLDLAARAELAINGLIGDVDPNRFYGVYQGFKFNADPPYIESGHTGKTEDDALYGLTLTPRNVRTLPMLRAMSGSDYGLQTEYQMMRTLLYQIGPSGEMFYPAAFPGAAGGLNYPERAGMMAFAVLTWYSRDQNPAWLNWLHLLATGLKKDAIHADERAYFPIQSAIDLQGKWHDIAGGEHARIPYHTPEEPDSDQQGTEGTAKQDQLRPLSTLVHDFELNHDGESIQLARELSREVLRSALWANTETEGYPGSEHGIFEGHFHATVHTFISVLDLAQADNDSWLKEFAREGYQDALRNGVVQLGWFPAIVKPEKFGRPAWQHTVDEACGVADMVVLAIRLSDAGLGDYWDDVDSIVRNQLTAQQVIDLDLMRRASGTNGEQDALLKRFLGGFGNASVTSIPPIADIAGCCTGNGPQALYYAWEGITRFQNGVATINLFLNRASAWMDVDSYLPYEGQVILHNKLAHTAFLRIPAWLRSLPIDLLINGKHTQPVRAGNYLVFDGLKANDVIALRFDVPQSTQKYTIDGVEYTISFRGSTVTDITPRDSGPHSYPLYLRSDMRAGKTPMRTKRRFVTDRLIETQVF
jgi:hypothetical protein